MKIDEIIPLIGGFGRYQFFLVSYIFLLAIVGCTVTFGNVFFAAETDHWCSVWPNETCSSWVEFQDNCTDVKKSISLPPSQGSNSKYPYSNCLQYEAPVGYVFDPYTPYVEVTNYTYNEVPCNDGWEYDTSQYKTTIIMDFNLVCDDRGFPSLSQSIYFVGVLVSSFVCGSLSDWIGRKKTMIFALVLMIVGSLATTFSLNIYMYIAFRFIAGFGNFGSYMVQYVLAQEVVGQSFRTPVSMSFSVSYAMGYCLLATLAMFVKEWRTLSLIISLSTVIFIFPTMFVQESVRWLVSKGRFDEAEVVIRRMGKWNRKTLPDVLFDKEDRLEYSTVSKEAPVQYSVIDLFRTPNMAVKTLNMMLQWVVNTLIYFGLSQSTGDLGVDEYWAFFVSGAVEIPALLYATFGVEWFGRKPNTSVLEIVGGVACLTTIFVPIGIWRTVVSMLGKLCISATYSIIYLYTAELFPTPVRTIGLGMCSVAGRVGGIVSPFILLLGDYVPALPSIVFASVAIIAGVLVLLLPETRGRQLPQTMKEGEEMGKCRCMGRDDDRNSIFELDDINAISSEGAPAMTKPDVESTDMNNL